MFVSDRGAAVWGVALIALGFLVRPALPEQAIVTKRDGRMHKGVIVRQDQSTVVLEISGIPMIIQRDDIESIIEDIELEYVDRRAALDDEDLDGHYQLIEFLFINQAYGLAVRELDDLKRQFPDSNKVNMLSVAVREQLRLQQQQPARPRPAGTGRVETDDPRTPGPKWPEHYLSPEQINQIRLWELPSDLMEAKPRVFVPRETLDQLFQRYARHESVPKGRRDQRRFRGARGYEQLNLIFQVQARDLYGQVEVREDPEPLRRFRQRVNPIYVVGYLHRYFGKGQIEGLRLYGRRPNVPDEAFTNFYLLTRFSHEGLPMIDRDRTQRSLLVQWGLPRDAAVHPAPEVEQWRPFFTGLDDPNVQRMTDWINSLYKPAPDYGIDFKWPPAKDVEAGERQPTSSRKQ